MLKSIVLLTTLIFLIMAPVPDAKDIADMTANLIILDHDTALMAAEIKQPEQESK
jgi:hypothetical protein